MKSILFIVNPRAGVDRIKSIEKAIQQNLDSNLFHWQIEATQYAQHGTEIAKSAAKNGINIVVSVGGDGSLNDVIQGLQGTSTVLGVIPMGSGNGLARSVGIPLKLEAAIKVLNKYNVHAIDLGLVDNRRFFISNAGVGFDAVVTEEFRQSKKRGFWSYVGIIFRKVWGYKPLDWSIEIDGETIHEKAFMITIANANQLGYNFFIAPIAQLNDGFFDIVIIKKHPKLLSGIIGLQAFTDSLLKNRYVKHYRGKNITLSHPQNRIMQMDGDSDKCEDIINITLMPESIQLLCP